MEYKFKLIKRDVQSDEKDLSTYNTVLIICDNHSFSNLCIKINAKSLDRGFAITSLYFDNHLNDGSESEHKGYLRGHFGFIDKDSLEKSLSDLKNTLNGQHMPNNHSESWKSFKESFFDWYTKVLNKVILSEIELFQECVRINKLNN
jgi:hypothetical protein